ncbi:MAG: hypothetical protein WCF06_04545 [Nitrososphaeraceae archaeon]
MSSEQTSSPVNSILKAFVKIHQEINNNSPEHDFSPRFVDYLVRGILGYRGNPPSPLR